MKNLQHKIAQGYPKPKQDSLTNSGDVLQFVDCDRAGPNYARCEVKLNDGTTSEYEIHIGKNGQHYTSRQLGFSIVEN
jgi:hypothetical protein